MLRVHFRLMKVGIPAGNQFKICAIWSFYFAYEVDILVEVSLGILNTDIRR